MPQIKTKVEIICNANIVNSPYLSYYIKLYRFCQVNAITCRFSVYCNHGKASDN